MLKLVVQGVLLLSISLLFGCSEQPSPMKSKSLHRFTQDVVLSAALAKDSNMVAILTDEQRVTVWDTRNKKSLQTWDSTDIGEEKSLIALSGNNKRLCVAGNWHVAMLDVVDGSVITNWDVQGFQAGATVSALHVDETGHRVLFGMSDGAVLSVDLKSQNALKLDHHKNEITRLLYGADNAYAISGSTDKNLAYWRTDNGEIVYQHNFRSRITALAFDGESNQLFVSDALKSHWILDSRNGNKLVELSFFERFRYFRQGIFMQKGDALVTSSPKSSMTLWNTHSGEELISWHIKQFAPDALVLAMTKNDADELVTLSSDGALQTWDIQPFLSL